MFRAKVQWTIAQQERRGVPLDAPWLGRIRKRWADMRPYGVYEIEAGVPHWRNERFDAYLRRNGMSWPRLPSGALDQQDQTFREMAGKYPQIEQLRELRYSLSKLRLNDLAVGNDGRNRTLLGAYGTKMARHAPSNSKYIFGPAKWLRFLITSPPGRALVYRDYSQQEVRIAAVLSEDPALLQACESGDVYLGIAKQLGFLLDSMNDGERKAVRALFKTVVLGIQYGLGARSLAVRIGILIYEACEILARLQARFCRFEDYIRSVIDHAGIDLEVSTPFDWRLRSPSGTNPRTLRNFPMQSTGSEILHVLCVLAERRGIEIVATIHDAVLAECPLGEINDVALALDRTMRDASALVLRGYELPTDCQLIRPGERYYDERGEAMWNTVTRLVAKLEREQVA
jgi:DNA polymerase-1